MGRKRPESEPSKCLGWLASAGYELLGTCPICNRRSRLSIAPLARKYGKAVHVSYLAQLMRCAECQHKPIELEAVRWDEDLEAREAFGEV